MVTYWESAKLSNLMYVMLSSVLDLFPCGVLGQVWYLIVSIPDLCLLTYYVQQGSVFSRRRTDYIMIHNALNM